MNKTLLKKTLRDLRRSWAQSIALIFIAALGVSSFVGLISAYRDLDSSYNHTYERLQFADVAFDVAAAPQTVTDEIATIAGIRVSPAV